MNNDYCRRKCRRRLTDGRAKQETGGDEAEEEDGSYFCHAAPSFVCSSHAVSLHGPCIHVRDNYRRTPPVARSVDSGRELHLSAASLPLTGLPDLRMSCMTLHELAAMPHLLRVLEE